jgi:hypothetical protein
MVLRYITRGRFSASIDFGEAAIIDLLLKSSARATARTARKASDGSTCWWQEKQLCLEGQLFWLF